MRIVDLHRSLFLNMQRTLFTLFSIAQCRKKPQGIRIRLGNQLFSHLETEKSSFLKIIYFFDVSVAKKELSARKTTLILAETSYGSEGNTL